MGRAAINLTGMRRGAVTSAGVRATDTLRLGGPGSVVAAFERSLYVAFEEAGAALVSIGGADFPMGPLNVASTLQSFAGLAPGTPARIEGASLRLGDQAILEVDFDGLHVWRPPPTPPWTPEAVAGGLVALRRLRTCGIADFAAALGGSPSTKEAVLRRATEGADAVRAWLRDAGPPDDCARVAAETLLGLGPGLTPSGDDFLVGALIALAHLRDKRRFTTLAQVVRVMAPARTAPVSAAHLMAAADGMAADPLHRTVAAIVGGGGDRLPTALAGLDAVGQSSGYDALIGAVTVLETITSSRSRLDVRRI